MLNCQNTFQTTFLAGFLAQHGFTAATWASGLEKALAGLELVTKRNTVGGSSASAGNPGGSPPVAPARSRSPAVGRSPGSTPRDAGGALLLIGGGGGSSSSASNTGGSPPVVGPLAGLPQRPRTPTVGRSAGSTPRTVGRTAGSTPRVTGRSPLAVQYVNSVAPLKYVPVSGNIAVMEKGGSDPAKFWRHGRVDADEKNSHWVLPKVKMHRMRWTEFAFFKKGLSVFLSLFCVTPFFGRVAHHACNDVLLLTILHAGARQSQPLHIKGRLCCITALSSRRCIVLKITISNPLHCAERKHPCNIQSITVRCYVRANRTRRATRVHLHLTYMFPKGSGSCDHSRHWP